MPLLSLKDAIAAHVRDGQTLALEGFTIRLGKPRVIHGFQFANLIL